MRAERTAVKLLFFLSALAVLALATEWALRRSVRTGADFEIVGAGALPDGYVSVTVRNLGTSAIVNATVYAGGAPAQGGWTPPLPIPPGGAATFRGRVPAPLKSGLVEVFAEFADGTRLSRASRAF